MSLALADREGDIRDTGLAVPFRDSLNGLAGLNLDGQGWIGLVEIGAFPLVSMADGDLHEVGEFILFHRVVPQNGDDEIADGLLTRAYLLHGEVDGVLGNEAVKCVV